MPFLSCEADWNKMSRLFWKKIKPKPNGCWYWKGWKHRNGYGSVEIGGRKKKKRSGAHRVSWEIHRGSIPKGLFVCHSCDIPHCVNPKHLFLGTQADNMRDASNKKRIKFNRYLGSSHPNSRLTEKEVQEIRNTPRYKGMREDLASKYGVSIHLISFIRSRNSWKHL